MSSTAGKLEAGQRFLTEVMRTQESSGKGEETFNAPVAESSIKQPLLALPTPGRVLKVKLRQISITSKAAPSSAEVQKSSAKVLSQSCYYITYTYTCTHATPAPPPAPRVIHVNCEGVPLGKTRCGNMGLYPRYQHIDGLCPDCSSDGQALKDVKGLKISDNAISPKVEASTQLSGGAHRYRGKIIREVIKRQKGAKENEETFRHERTRIQKEKHAAAITNMLNAMPNEYQPMRWTVVDNYGLTEQEKMLRDSDGIKAVMEAEALKDATVKAHKKGLVASRKGFSIHKDNVASLSTKSLKGMKTDMDSEDKSDTCKKGVNEINYVDQGYDAGDWDMIEEFEDGDWIKVPETKLPKKGSRGV